MYRYENAVLISNFYRNYKIRRGINKFVSQRNFKQTFVQEVFFKKIECLFFVEIRIYTKTHPFLMKVRTRQFKKKKQEKSNCL